MSWIDGTTETRPCPGGPATAIAYRPTLVQKLELGLLVGVVVGTENAIMNGGLHHFWVGPLIFAALFTLSSLLPTGAGTVITRDGVTVRSFSRRTLRWGEIASITRERRLGGARFILLHEAGGRTTRLQGITAGPLARDPGFDAKYETINDWWSAGRAVDSAGGHGDSAVARR